MEVDAQQARACGTAAYSSFLTQRPVTRSRYAANWSVKAQPKSYSLVLRAKVV